jgi:hypothetical protein
MLEISVNTSIIILCVLEDLFGIIDEFPKKLYDAENLI